jgi:uncharacterized protein (TIGR03435 family)
MNSSRFAVLASLFVFMFGVRFGVPPFEVRGSAFQVRGSAFQVRGSGSGSSPAFEVVSVRENLSIQFESQSPDGFRRANLPLDSYVTYAFGIRQRSRVDGLPDWARSARYDIVARAATPITEAQRQLMLRDVLVTRFQLRTHFESREQTIYVMTAARPDKRLGPGLTRRTDCTTNPCTSSGTGRPDGLSIRATTLAQLADGMLSNLQGQVVRDETGIDGVFDVTMSWRPESATPDANDSRPSFFTAMQEQLGLKLEPQKRPVEVLVIDRLERPTVD